MNGQFESLLAELSDDSQTRFLALWRLLRERACGEKPWLAFLPADTRTPDHTVWQHNDITTGLSACDWGEKTAFLLVSLGPVQSFISTSRTLRDLWTGSMTLSWLVFQAMLPIIEKLGPTAFVYPMLRENPLMDRWLRRFRPQNGEPHNGAPPPLEKTIKRPDPHLLKTPCLPNRFVALVPWGSDGQPARDLAAECDQRLRKGWQRLCSCVREELDKQIHKLEPLRAANWDRLWDDQCNSFFDVRAVALPWKDTKDDDLALWLSGQPHFEQALAFQDVTDVRGLAQAIPDADWPGAQGDRKTAIGQWQLRLELCARLLAAQKNVAHFPKSATDVNDEALRESPSKCSMFGSFEQMGPANRQASQEFWDCIAGTATAEKKGGVTIGSARVRPGERLCALALVKRFAGQAFFIKELGLDRGELTWPDTATVAAAPWLSRTQLHERKLEIGIDPRSIRDSHDDWSGQWLHRAGRDQDDDDEPCPDEIRQRIRSAVEEVGSPPAYYAILMLDGDEMGKWLAGKNSPLVGEVMHPKLKTYFESLRGIDGFGQSREQLVKSGLKAPRHVGPALHAAISEALANFALHFVPKIVKQHQGELIYAGGDDVLAFLPTSTALACARQLCATFRENWKDEERDDQTRGPRRLLMGSRATLSAGIAVVHYKEDLRFALEQARAAEKSAKNSGRDAVELRVLRRSGEHAAAICPWDFVPTIEALVQAFRPDDGKSASAADKESGASDRWAYRLRAELETLRALPPEAMSAEIARQVNRADETTRRRIAAAAIVVQASRLPVAAAAAIAVQTSRLPVAADAPRQSVDRQDAAMFLADAFESYRNARKPSRDGQPGELRFTDDKHDENDTGAGQALTGFVTLCQSASFLARGRDQ